MNPNVDHVLKFVVVGDSGVGKSSLLTRFINGQWLPIPNSTIGIDFHIKTYNINGKKIQMQFWDTAGQERYRSLTCSYFRNAVAILIIYDVANTKTLENVDNWLECIYHCGANPLLYLIGNKNDMEEANIDEVLNMANIYNMPAYMVSAKTGDMVDETFNQIINNTIANRLPNISSNVVIENKPKGVKRCCP